MSDLYFSFIELLLWMVVSVVILIFVVLFIYRSSATDLKGFNLAAASVFFALFFDSFKRVILPGNIYMIFFSNVLLALFTVPMVYHLEKYIVRKTHQIVSYISFVLIGIYIVAVLLSNFARDVMNLFILFPLLLELGLISFVYIYLIIKSTGIIRKSSVLIFVGLGLTITFWFLHSQFGRTGSMPQPGLQDLIGIISPICITIGLTIAALGFFKYRQL